MEALSPELQRRHGNVRAAMAEHDLDALIVSGSEYSGFEGSVTYLSVFQPRSRAVAAICSPGRSWKTCSS